MSDFALIGAAGFVAPRHMAAIRETGHRLVAALDKSDSVGVLDQYFPEADFFTEFERFDRHVEKLRRESPSAAIRYVSIASPNYLHDAHIRFALRVGADAICEKPIVLNPWNVAALKEIERETGRRAHALLQLRHHPAVQALKERVETGPPGKIYDLELSFISGRGRWYFYSWKGDEAKSGGIATNLGIHFFDLLIWIFGRPRESVVHLKEPDRAAGFLMLEKARVRWFLSLRLDDVPEEARAAGRMADRRLIVDGQEVDFGRGFEGLHTEAYRAILAGRGFGLDDSLPAIEAVYGIRHADPRPARGEKHSRLR